MEGTKKPRGATKLFAVFFMSLDGGQLLNDKVDGDPQYLPPGDNTITWTGTVARLVVTPNWRFL